MHFFYGLADEKYILYRTEYKPKRGPFENLCYTEEPPVLKNLDKWERNEPSRVFRATPDTLVQLCLNVIDKFPMQMPYEWTNTDVLRWIRRYGYPHYMRTFRKNMINGRTLLLVDANALCAMNIKNWDDIKHIAYGIRQLFFFEMAKFARSISLPQNELKELYKLFRVKTGPKYEEAKRSHYWRFMKFVREKAPNYNHWEILERWLAFIPDKEFAEVFGEVHRTNMYKCRLGQPEEEPVPRSIFDKVFDYENAPSIYEVIKRGYNKCKRLEIKHLRQSKGCKCHEVPCECHWPKSDYSAPRVMTCLQKQIEDSSSHACLCWHPCDCKVRYSVEPPPQSVDVPKCDCWPPCECHWKQHEYRGGYTMTALRKGMPHDYCLNYYGRRKRDFAWREKVYGVVERGSMARKSAMYEYGENGEYGDNDEGEGEE